MKRMIFFVLLILAVSWAGAGCRPGGGQEPPSTGTAPPTGESVPVPVPAGTEETTLDEDYTHLIIDQLPGITVTNAEGQSLTFNGPDLLGDLPVVRTYLRLMNDASTELVLENSDSLEIAYEDGNANFYMFTLRDYSVGVEGTGVSKILCDFVQRSGTVEGDHAKYTITLGTGLEGYSRCLFTAKGPGFFQRTDDGIEVQADIYRIELRNSMKGSEINELEVPQTEHFLLRPHDDGTAEITVLEEP